MKAATGLPRTWAATIRSLARATDSFHTLLEARTRSLVPHRQLTVFFTGLGRLSTGRDDPAGRAALLRVLARGYRRLDLRPTHHELIAETLAATVARFGRTRWTVGLTTAWTRAASRAVELVAHHADLVGAGPAWWSAEVVTHNRPARGVAILTVRPHRRLPHQAGQAVPVCLPDRRPGVWRWLSPANAPRPDGGIELHVRAQPDGELSGLLVNAIRPGEQLWLGPAADVGLCLDARSRADLLLIAGGTGLAPLRAIVEQLATTDGAGRRVTLIVGARVLGELYDPVNLDKLQCAHRRWLSIRPVFDRDPCVGPAERGTAVDLALWHLRDGQDIYVCGPPAMTRATQLRLLVEGVPANRIHLPRL